MDFWYCFQIQKEKLKNIPTSSISELIDEEGKFQENCEHLRVFLEHLPLAPEDFWQTALQSIIEFKNDSNIDIDDFMIQYILIIISWYTNWNPKSDFSETSSLLACEFYFRLLNLLELRCFKGSIYENALDRLSKKCEHSGRNIQCHKILKVLKQFLNKQIPQNYLERTLYRLCHIIEDTSNKVYSDYSEENGIDTTHEALHCIRTLAKRDWSSKYSFMINYTLLYGTITNHRSDILKKNFRNLIVDLRSTLKKDNFSNFQNVFLYNVVKSKMFDPMEASKIMVILNEQFFKGTIFKLTNMGVSKEISDKNNILRLFAVFLEHLPTTYYEHSKLEVFIQTVFNILVMNCINNDEAIYLVSKICILNKPVINKQFEFLLNSPTEYVFVENSLPTFCMKFNIHWTNRLRNRNILLIILRIMCITYRNSSDEDYASILAMISSEADPSDMRMSIPILLNLYAKSRKEGSKYVSDKVVEVMYNMSIHNSSGSSDFVKTLFQLAVEPSEELLPYKSDYIENLTTHILNDNKRFITKAHELKLLEQHSIKRLISRVIKGDYDYLKLTCAVVEKSESQQGEKLVYHIMANPDLLCEAKYIADLLFITNCGLKYFVTFEGNVNLTSDQRKNLKDFKELLWEHIEKFTLSHNSLGNGLDVLKTLSHLLREPMEFQGFFQNVNSELKTVLSKIPDNCNVVPIMYSTELMSFQNYDIPEETIQVLNKALDKITQILKNEDSPNTFVLVRYYCCLVLIVRVAMKHSKLGPKAMEYLRNSLVAVDFEFKMKVMDLMYDLCTYVVHNFDEFLQYSFRNLKNLNPAIRTQAAIHIEHFTSQDYLKLSIQQYCKFISLLGDPMIEKRLQKLLMNFVLVNQSVVEKYFLPLLMHLNYYSVHPVCPMSSQYMQDLNCIIRANFDKWKVFSTLFRSLPQRSKFLILKEICSTFFDKFIKGEMKIADGVWNVLIDSMALFKILAYNSIDNVKYEEFYDKGMSGIKKYLIEKKNLPSDFSLKYQDAKDVIEVITFQLLHLLFYTDNEQILKNFKLKLFEAIMFWTYDVLPDLATACNLRKDKMTQKISNYYIKLTEFYKKHKQCLNQFEYISEYNESHQSV